MDRPTRVLLLEEVGTIVAIVVIGLMALQGVMDPNIGPYGAVAGLGGFRAWRHRRRTEVNGSKG